MKIKVDRLEERLATELAKNFDMNFKSAIDRIKQQKDELKKRGKEIVELKESLEKLAIEEEKLEKQLDEEVNKGFELEGKYNDLKKKFDSETIALYELVGELVNEKEKLEKEIEERSKTVAYWKNQADLWKQNSNEYQRFWEGQKAMVKKAIEELKAKDLLIETYEARKSADLETMQKLGKRIEELEIENEKLANPHDCEENQVIEWEDGQPINVKCGECKAILWRKE
jgi:chromosome segregation ATPase